ncbi:MAG: ATP-grasp domain-containing protein [Candidatus Bathyarchaeota archaeon]|nr:MAG: ATP-grasp domain-containing protein [Candidatus Bathyarchaeota archaeon]
MPSSEFQSLLVLGIDLVALANSASRAGYQVYAADYFGDSDLHSMGIRFKSVTRQDLGQNLVQLGPSFGPEALLSLAKPLVQENEIDAILLSSGLDDCHSILCELNELAPILGNSPQTIQKVREKPEFFDELKRLGILHPETALASDIEEAKKMAAEIGYPVMIKPSEGFGGIGIRTARNQQELKRRLREVQLVNGNVLIQQRILGTHASISLLASHSKVKVLTINEQLIGLSATYQSEPYGYCGNVVPLSHDYQISTRCEELAEKITSHFGLAGSNGIDLVISEEGKPYVIELNPRFQGTLECVERKLGMNLVEAHIRACVDGFLPTLLWKGTTFHTRLILYAPQSGIVPDLTILLGVEDIPLPGTVVEKNAPLCSVITNGSSRDDSLQKAQELASAIFEMLSPAKSSL